MGGGGGGGVMNWEIGIDIYTTLICVKWVTNKNLLYKKMKLKKKKNWTQVSSPWRLLVLGQQSPGSDTASPDRQHLRWGFRHLGGHRETIPKGAMSFNLTWLPGG